MKINLDNEFIIEIPKNVQYTKNVMKSGASCLSNYTTFLPYTKEFTWIYVVNK